MTKNLFTFSLTINPLAKLYYLQLYLLINIVFSGLLMFWDGHGGDLGYWENWTKQLGANGYANFDGNYPPLYIHWLYFVASIHEVLGVPLRNGMFLKYCSQLPGIIYHLFLVCIVFAILQRVKIQRLSFHALMAITALNPAIFYNGVIWGQVDILPVIPAMLAILVSQNARYQLLSFPLYTLALLTKFQMIAFAPVMGLIFLRHFKVHLLGIVASIPVIALAFLPSILAGNFVQSFKLAYIDVLHQYGATTLGAANIWILLTGSAAPDTIVLFNVKPDSLAAVIFKAKNFGMLCFVLYCVAMFICGVKKVVLSAERKEIEVLKLLFFYAMGCATAFFTLLPAMHERYLLPAAIAAIFYAALEGKKIIYPALLTFICAFNIAICFSLSTHNTWPSLSWLMLLAFFYLLFQMLFGQKWLHFSAYVINKVLAWKFSAPVMFFACIGTIGVSLYWNEKPIVSSLKPNEVRLSQLPIVHSAQDYGYPSIDKSVSGNYLRAGKRTYAHGIGSHANSTIEYSLPDNVEALSVLVGLDDAVESASVQFFIGGMISCCGGLKFIMVLSSRNRCE